MLKELLVIPLFLAAVQARGEFAVISAPSGLRFDGKEPLNGSWITDLLDASMGFSITGTVDWPAFTIVDPFSVAKGIVMVMVDGIDHIPLNDKTIYYELIGDGTDKSIGILSRGMKSAGEAVCDINFRHFNEGVKTFDHCFLNMTINAVSVPDSLHPSLSEARRNFKESLAYMYAGALGFGKMRVPAHFVIMRISLSDLVTETGIGSSAVSDAKRLLKALTLRLNGVAQAASNGTALVLLITEQEDRRRVKRSAFAADAIGNKYNLAEYYDEDYPVIFNIILWFMVTFGFSLLAICYAIGSMDPGRDSIIYRMTSTRMKKDN